MCKAISLLYKRDGSYFVEKIPIWKYMEIYGFSLYNSGVICSDTKIMVCCKFVHLGTCMSLSETSLEVYMQVQL